MTNPSGIYGASKLAGERAIADSGRWYVILRTAWVFSEYGQNFLKPCSGWAANATRCDCERSSWLPNHAGDLAFALLTILKSIENGTCSWGLYHYAGDSAVSWYEFASAIFAQAKDAGLGVPEHVTAIATEEYPTQLPAPRGPFWTVRFHERLGQAALTGREAW